MSHSLKYRVSVVMTVYNGEMYLKRQMDSILKNLNSQDELIIGDDGSTDFSISILDQYVKNDSRIKIIKNQHLGTTKNLESLIKICRGDIIFISDQDDLWCENKVAKICEDFDLNPEIDLVFHNSKVSSSDENDIIHTSLFEYLPPSNKFVRNLLYFHFWGCMFAFRRKAMEYIVPFRFGFDSWIIFCATFFNKCYLEEKVLITYRRHGNNLSTFKRRNLVKVLTGHLSRLIVFMFYLPITVFHYKRSRKM